MKRGLLLAGLLVIAGCGSTVVTRTVTRAARVAHKAPAKPKVVPRAAPMKLSVSERCRKLIPTENPNAPDTTQAACEYSLTPHPATHSTPSPCGIVGGTIRECEEVRQSEARSEAQRRTCADIESQEGGPREVTGGHYESICEQER